MSYIGQQLPADVFSGFTTDAFTGDGSATTFTLSKAPFSEDGLIVVINNVIQRPTTNFTVSGTTLTIVGTAVADGDVIYAIHTSGAVPSTLASKVDVNGLSDGVILDADADTTISADTDDQIDFKAGGADIMSLTDALITMNGKATITVADNTDNLTLTSTDADANAGPNLRFYRNSSSPADDDLGGVIEFEGRNDNSQDVVYTRIETFQSDVTDGEEDAAFTIETMLAGTLRERMGMGIVATVFNDDGQNIDFRVESDSQTTMFNLQAAHASNSAGTIGFNSSNSDGNFFEAVNPQAGVYTGKMIASASSSNVYTLGLTISAQAPDDNTSLFIGANDNAAGRFQVKSDGDVVNHDNSYGSLSDERIKQDIVDSGSQWDDIKAVKVRKFKKKDDVRQYSDKAWVQIGVIAQELEAAGMDKLIKHSNPTSSDIESSSDFGTLYTSSDSETKDGEDAILWTEDDNAVKNGLAKAGEIKTEATHSRKVGDVKEVKAQVKKVGYSVLYMKAIKALQEAMAKIETLETKVKALEDA